MPRHPGGDRLLQRQKGQALVLVALMMPVLLGFAGLAIDIGRLTVERRHLQNVADAAALAGAPNLPSNTGQATTDATTLLGKNNYTAGTNGAQNPSITYSQTYQANDTITVSVTRALNLFFFPVLGISAQNVSAKAVVVQSGINGCNFINPPPSVQNPPNSFCFPFTIWDPTPFAPTGSIGKGLTLDQAVSAGWSSTQPGCQQPPNQPPDQVGNVLSFRTNGWAQSPLDSSNPNQLAPNSCYFIGSAKDYKGFLREGSAAGITGPNAVITTKGGNSCGSPPNIDKEATYTPLLNYYAQNNIPIILPVIGTAIAASGSSISVTIVGFYSIQLDPAFTYTCPFDFHGTLLSKNPGSFPGAQYGACQPPLPCVPRFTQ